MPRWEKPWVPEDDVILDALYGKVPGARLAQILGRSVASVRGRGFQRDLATPMVRLRTEPKAKETVWLTQSPS